MLPEFNHQNRRAKRMVDPFVTADKVDDQGQQVQLITEAVNILANKVASLEEQLAESKSDTKRGPGRPRKTESKGDEGDD